MPRTRSLIILVAALSAVATVPSPSGAQTAMGWQLVEIVDYDKPPADKEYALSYTRGTIGWRWSMNGDAWGFQSTWTPPPQTIVPGERVTLEYWVLVNEDTGDRYSAGGEFSISFDRPEAEPGVVITPIGFTNEKGESGHVEIRHRVKTPPIGRKVWAQLPAGKPGQRTALLAQAYNGRSAGTKYIYEWRGPLTPEEKRALEPPSRLVPVRGARTSAGPPPLAGLRDSGTRFSSISGEVEVFHEGQTRRDAKFAKLDTILYVGDHIVVGEESSAIVGFRDLSTHLLKEETEVVITTPPEKDSKIGLVMGTIWTNVKKMWKDGTMEVEMTQGSGGIKGTTVVFETTRDESTVKVIEGTVQVRSKASGETVSIGGGTMVTMTAAGLGPVRSFATAAESATWDSVRAGASAAANAATNASNLALGKPAVQSSTAYAGAAGRAVDGNTDGTFLAGSVTHTANGPEEWWQVDLGASRTIDRIVVWNRQDCCVERLASFWILVSETPFPPGPVPAARAGASVWRQQHPGAAGRETRVSVGARGRYVRVQLTGQDYLSLAEVEVIGR